MRRLLTVMVVVALGLLISGCGIAVRAPVDPADPYVTPRATPVLPAAPTEPLVPRVGQTVVSLTFDDGWASQKWAAEVLTDHDLPGTFFVNSGTIGMRNYLSLADLDAMALSGHEIGGHTLSHEHLERLTGDEMRRQICKDRVALLDWGFPVRSFAYPFGMASPDNLEAVQQCGYNSARGLSSLLSLPGHECGDCARTEDLPPVVPMLTRAPDQVESDWTADNLKQLVTDAGPGWLQIAFHGFCSDDCTRIQAHDAVFEEFVTWLTQRRDAGEVTVATVGDVIGGPVQPPVPGPVVPPPAKGANGVTNPGLEDSVDGLPRCWMQGGFGDNSAELSLVPGSHGGSTAARLVVSNYVSGDAMLLQRTDLGECAPSVTPGHSYTLEAWYTSTVPTAFSVQYRLKRGVWVYAVTSEKFPAADAYAPARWTLPPIPDDVTAVSFGLALSQDGEVVTDDYALIDHDGAPS